MKEDITDEDIKKVWDSSVKLSFQKIFADLNLGKLPNVNPVILSNGYGAGISIDYYEDKNVKRDIKHLYISNPRGKIDNIIADNMALKILGAGYVFIDLMSTKKVYHYMKD